MRRNVERRMTAERSDGARKSSGITTVTKLLSPCGKRQMYSSIASSGSSSSARISRRGLPSVQRKKRGPIPGSLPGNGTCTARNEPSEIDARTRAPRASPRPAARRRERRCSRSRDGRAPRAPWRAAAWRRAVVPPDAVERDDHQRDRDDHHPRAGEELRRDHDHGRRRTSPPRRSRSGGRSSASPAGGSAASSAPSQPARA